MLRGMQTQSYDKKNEWSLHLLEFLIGLSNHVIEVGHHELESLLLVLCHRVEIIVDLQNVTVLADSLDYEMKVENFGLFYIHEYYCRRFGSIL